MVSKQRKAAAVKTYPRARRGDDGVWLCNTVDRCDQEAVQQATYPCTGCDDIRAQTQAGIDRKRAELKHHDEIEQQVLEAARDDDRELSDIEKVHLQVVALKRRDLGSDLELLEAAKALADADHTHPVFACAKHTARLPQ